MQYCGKEVGLRIKKLRKRRNMTQTQLAERLCYATERQLQRIENGEAACPVDRMVELAEILDTTTDYLLRGKEVESKKNSERYYRISDVVNVIIVEL